MSGVSISSFEKVTSRHSKRPGATPARTHLAGHARKGFANLTHRRQPSSAAVLLVAAFGAFLAFLDSTIVNIEFPDIQKSFPSYDLGGLSWILNAYNIVFAAFLVAAGRMADLLGRRRTFTFGVVIFTIASGLCAVAGSVEWLVAFRVLQGIGAAVLVPASLALVVEGFEPARRAHAVGLWGAAAAIASGLGPPIGGMLVDWASWRWVFLVNIPLGVVAVLATSRALVESRAAGRRRKPDLRGATLLAGALGLLTLELVKGPDWGWVSVPTLAVFAASAITLVGFVLSSMAAPVPLVEPAYLRSRPFVVGNLLTLVAALLGRVADRHGHRVIVTLGALVWAGSLFWYLQRVGAEPDFLRRWLPGQLLQGIGVGATLPVLSSAALTGVAKGGSYATTSAVVSTTRQLGAVIGVAALVILIGKPEHGAAADALRRGWAMAAICFVVVAIAAVLLGRTKSKPGQELEPEPAAAPRAAPTTTEPVAALIANRATDEVDLLGNLPLFAGLDAAALAELADRVEEVELQAGSYLFLAGDASDSLYVIRRGRVQVLHGNIVIKELGRGEVLGELGLLIDAPRSASVRALRDSRLVRLTKAQFDQIADRGVLAALVRVLATRLREAPPPAVHTTSPGVVVSVVGVGADAPVQSVAAGLLTALSKQLRVVDPGRVDIDGLDRAERGADKVLLHAGAQDADWRDFCLRVADRIVLVTGDPDPGAAALPARAQGADLVLAGPTASREQRRSWEQLITPRSVHAVHYRRVVQDLRPLAARLAGRSIGLVLGGGGARGFAHLGILEELEQAGVAIDRFAGTSMGAVIASLGASGLDAATADAYAYEYFIRNNPLRDYAVPIKGLVRGRRTLTLLEAALGDRLVEELPKEFRCVSVDLIARQPVVHRRGRLVDVVGCSLRLPGIYPPQVYQGRLHVDGGVLDNLPVSTLATSDGPLIAVSLASGEVPGAPLQPDGPPRVPGIGDTLIRTMTIGSQRGADVALGLAQVVIRPDTSAVGLLEFHQIDAAREAGRAAARESMPQIMALLNQQR
ncbi:Multidrug resistance protein stp [Mycobacterium shottsii]|uniref:MFS transporter n=1 Tax=Mycobacterium shottsii TaxID=133549 RepID=A0A7I7LM53_9MYCO|nr:MFS transporter [Mycobacterium shottsii]QYL30178.1 Multidrug resistance protein stp [Mycobacterium shottsii]BBX60657.1 MFS transporter [Mycobacterium shottsii]